MPTLNLQLKIICCAYTLCPEPSLTLLASVPVQHSIFSPLGQEAEGHDNLWVVQTLKCSKFSFVLILKHHNKLIISGGMSIITESVEDFLRILGLQGEVFLST